MWMRQKKWIALYVILAFIGLLQAAAMPLRAEQAPGHAGTTLAIPEAAPSVIEEEGGAAAPGKKKSILPIVIGVVALGAIAAVLALVVFKTKYDIVGRWDFSFTSSSPAHTWVWTLVFNGDKKSGVFIDNLLDKGTYSVNDKDVTIQYDEWEIKLTGKFDSKDKMSGSATFVDLTVGGLDITNATWTATRLSSGSSLRPGSALLQAPADRKARKSGI
jgi:hypothetical protein